MIEAALEGPPLEKESVEEELSIQAKVHAALDRHNGDRKAAAAELGMTLQTIKNKIYESPILRRRWTSLGEESAPDDLATVYRPIVSVDQERQARQYALDAENFRKNFHKMPLTPEEKEQIIAAWECGRENVRYIIDTAIGGLELQKAQLMGIIKQKKERLSEVSARITAMGGDISEERMAAVEEEEKLTLQITALTNEYRKHSQTQADWILKKAAIDYKVKGGMKKAKPGFQTIDA